MKTHDCTQTQRSEPFSRTRSPSNTFKPANDVSALISSMAANFKVVDTPQDTSFQTQYVSSNSISSPVSASPPILSPSATAKSSASGR